MNTLLDHLLEEFQTHSVARVDRSVTLDESRGMEAVRLFVEFAQQYLLDHPPEFAKWSPGADRNQHLRLSVTDYPIPIDLQLTRDRPEPERRDTSISVFNASRGNSQPQAPPHGIGGR